MNADCQDSLRMGDSGKTTEAGANEIINPRVLWQRSEDERI